MNSELLSIIISSGVGALVSFTLLALSIGKYREKIDRHDKYHDKISNKLAEISEKLSSIEGGLLIRDKVQDYIRSKSPLGLTKKGEALLIDSKGKDYIDSKKKEFLTEIKLHNPKTAYDVQELSKSLIEQRTSLEEFNIIKDFAFKKGLTVQLILEVLSIYLRDFLLKKLNFQDKNVSKKLNQN